MKLKCPERAKENYIFVRISPLKCTCGFTACYRGQVVLHHPRQSMCQHLSSVTQQVERCEICVFTSYFPCKHFEPSRQMAKRWGAKPLYKCWEMTNAAAAQGGTAGVHPGLLTSSFIHSPGGLLPA